MSQVLYSADVTVTCACASMRGVLHRSVWSFLYLHSKPLTVFPVHNLFVGGISATIIISPGFIWIVG